MSIRSVLVPLALCLSLAACRQAGLSYSVFMNALKRAGVLLDRKILAELAVSDPAGFAKLAETAKAQAR